MKNIKKLRGVYGLSQSELARYAEVTRMTIINAEKNSCHYISKTATEKICKVLNCSPVMLYGVDNFRYIPTNIEEVEYMKSILDKIIEKEVNANNGSEKGISENRSNDC